MRKFINSILLCLTFWALIYFLGLFTSSHLVESAFGLTKETRFWCNGKILGSIEEDKIIAFYSSEKESNNILIYKIFLENNITQEYTCKLPDKFISGVKSMIFVLGSIGLATLFVFILFGNEFKKLKNKED